MLSYRHHFHAGCHADVFKHIGLVLLLMAMKRKEKPLFYLDTHSGAGIYDLKSPMAQKNNEQAQGILKIWGRGDIPDLIKPYIQIIERMNPSGNLQLYPGSPWIAHQLLDEQDRLVLNELHSTDVHILADMTRHFRHMKVFHQDGLLQLNALLPPPERRGLIFIDPSYEIKSDYLDVAQTVIKAHKKFSTGVYAIWYPLLKSGVQNALLDTLEESGIENQFKIQFRVNGDKDLSMYGSGLILINPPYQVDTQLKEAVKWLAKMI
jgi:23S rRNA (adenine2030-N6)-methyltransferase